MKKITEFYNYLLDKEKKLKQKNQDLLDEIDESQKDNTYWYKEQQFNLRKTYFYIELNHIEKTIIDFKSIFKAEVKVIDNDCLEFKVK